MSAHCSRLLLQVSHCGENISEITDFYISGANHEDSKEHMERVRLATLPHYDQLAGDCEKIPDYLKSLKML